MAELEYIELKVDDLQVLTPEQAWHYRIIPKEKSSSVLSFFVDEQSATTSLQEELEMLFGKKIELEKKPAFIISNSLSRHYRKEKRDTRIKNLSYNGGSDDFLTDLIAEAKNLRSSDIHIESYEERCRIRIRIDGMLVERYVVNKDEYPSLINKIKILSNLDIAEKRLPQDGRIFFEKKGLKFDIRVSVLPTLYGEKVVMRLLNNDATNIDIRSLGFSDFDLQNFLDGTRMPKGIMLISGPTGSGKTTTLYATLKLLNESTRNILTIEDPIEYTLEGVNQVQLKESIGLGFASTLRTFLRQDPNVIMVGEIRDPDTASMAIRLALTGHLVLSTIHTNSAWGTVSRLRDMGIPPFLISDTLNTSVAQRLVKLLCPHCKQQETFDEKLYPKQFKPLRKVSLHYKHIGCESCYFTGYKGRKAVYEVIPIDYELSEKIKTNDNEISNYLKEKNIKTLGENAFELFEKGETSLQEVYSLLSTY